MPPGYSPELLQGLQEGGHSHLLAQLAQHQVSQAELLECLSLGQDGRLSFLVEKELALLRHLCSEFYIEKMLHEKTRLPPS